MLIKSVLSVVALVTITAVSQAQQVSAVNGTSFNTSAISHQTRGSEMTNMEVIVCMSTGCVNKSWGSLSGGKFGVQEAGLFKISMGANTDTFLSAWRFDMWGTANLQSIQFNGRTGNTIFDRTLPFLGSPGSSFGMDGLVANQCVTRVNGSNCANFGGMSVVYSNRVSVNNTFYGDEFESVLFDFTGVKLTGPDKLDGFDSDFTTRCTKPRRKPVDCTDVGFDFYLDSDNAVLDSPTTTTSVVPEPSTYALMSVGLLLVGGAARKRRKQNA